MGRKRPGRPDELNRRLRDAIDERRQRNGLSVYALASASKINRATLDRLFAGQTTWDVAYLQMVASALGCSLRDLFDDADPTGELTDFSQPARLRPAPLTHATVEVEEYPHAAYSSDDEPGQDWDSRYDSA